MSHVTLIWIPKETNLNTKRDISPRKRDQQTCAQDLRLWTVYITKKTYLNTKRDQFEYQKRSIWIGKKKRPADMCTRSSPFPNPISSTVRDPVNTKKRPIWIQKEIYLNWKKKETCRHFDRKKPPPRGGVWFTMFPDQEPCVRDFTTRCDGLVNRKPPFPPRGGGFFRSICTRSAPSPDICTRRSLSQTRYPVQGGEDS